jgi:hypothetical protein
MNAKDGENGRHLFPDDPLVAHTPPPGLVYQEILEQKRRNYSEMIELAGPFGDSSKLLVETAAFLSMQCHFNHYRGGGTRPHYSIHPLEVARRVDNNFGRFRAEFEQIRDQCEKVLVPRAIAISVGLLHDAIEDFFENFKSSDEPISKRKGQELCEIHLTNRIGELFGVEAARKIVSFIKILSIYNDDEFPTTDYLARIRKQTYAFVVKLADVDHNLSTFVDFSPVYACLVIPAQFSDFAVGTVYEDRYIEELLPNLNAFDPGERASWRDDPKPRTTDYLLSKLESYEGIDSLHTLSRFYSQLLSHVQFRRYDSYLIAKGFSKDHLMRQIRLVLDVIHRRIS